MAAGRSLNLTDQPISLPQESSSRGRAGGVPGFGWADYTDNDAPAAVTMTGGATVQATRNVGTWAVHGVAPTSDRWVEKGGEVEGRSRLHPTSPPKGEVVERGADAGMKKVEKGQGGDRFVAGNPAVGPVRARRDFSQRERPNGAVRRHGYRHAGLAG